MKKAFFKTVLVLLAGLLLSSASADESRSYSIDEYVPPSDVFPIPDLLRKAQEGDAEAQVEMGKIYRNGIKGVPANLVQAYIWFRKAEKQNNAEAIYQLGNMYLNFEVGPVDETPLSVRTHMLDYVYPVNYTKVLELYKRASDLNHIEAQRAVGYIYRMEWQNGKQVRPDADMTLNWYRNVADKGNGYAMVELFKIYQYGWDNIDGRTIVKADKNEAAKWHNKAIEHRDPGVLTALALVLQERGDRRQREEAVSLFRKAAEQNYAWAQYYLGFEYGAGNGVKKDRTEAAKWLRMAGENGDEYIQYRIGEKFATGDGVKKDLTEAAKWFRMAGESGNAEIQFQLGELYKMGIVVKKDITEAKKWYKLAAENGNAYILSLIANEYDTIKDGLKKNPFKDYYEVFKLSYKVRMEGLPMVTWRTDSGYRWYLGASARIGHLYLRGHGVPNLTLKEAKIWDQPIDDTMRKWNALWVGIE